MIPRLSVVMSVYNAEKYLAQTIDSVLNQTFKDYEFIILDDASTDGTLQIIQDYAQKDARIKVVENKENLGITLSPNKGFGLVQGEYIARHDGDDLSVNTRLQKQVEYLDNHPDVGLVGTHNTYIDENNEFLGLWKAALTDQEIRKAVLVGTPLCHASIMFRSKILNAVKGYRSELGYANDYDFIARIMDHGKAANIGEGLYKVRKGIGSISDSNLSQMLNDHLLVIELIKKRRQGEDDAAYLKQIDRNHYEQSLIDVFHLNKSEIRKFKSDYVKRYYYRDLDSKNYLSALKYWFKSFCYEPERWKIRALCEEFYRKSFLTPKNKRL